MNELPVIFDEPAPAGDSAAVASPRLSRGRPLWMAPAWLLGRFRPRLRAASTADALALERFPRLLVEVLPVLLVLAVAVGFAAIHSMHHYQNSRAGIEWTRWVLADTFFEVPAFLLFAILVGEALPSLGVAFVLVFAFLDIGVSATQPQELTPLVGALAGRLISMWALWLLAVEIPIFGRSIAGSWRGLAQNRFVAAGLAGLTAGSITWLWTQAAPIMERPMFSWSALGDVAIAAYRPVQQGGLVFAVFAGIVATVTAVSRGGAGLADLAPRGNSPVSASPLRRALVAVAVAAFFTLTLGGVIASPFEAVAMFAALLGTGPLARFVADRTVIGTLVAAVPVALRYFVAVGLSIGASWLVLGQLYQLNRRANIGNPNNEFFSVLFAIGIAYFVVAVATTPGAERPRSLTRLASSTTTMLVVGGCVLAFYLATPVTVLADNCSSLGDCWDAVKAAALAASGFPVLFAVLSKIPDGSFKHKQPPDPTRGGLFPRPPPGKQDPYMWSGDGYPPEDHALCSACANDGMRM